MIPSAFEHVIPLTVQETVALLTTHQDRTRLSARGHRLLPRISFKRAWRRAMTRA